MTRYPGSRTTRRALAAPASPRAISPPPCALCWRSRRRSAAAPTSTLSSTRSLVSWRETLGFQTVVLNVYRPEWDDFCVATVHGNDPCATHCSARSTTGAAGRRSWTSRFARAGAYFIPNDAFDWSQDLGERFVPAGEPAVAGPEGWHPNDELFVPLENSGGQIVGIMSFGDPVDGRRPDDEQLANAVALASHAALALEAAQERARSQRHQSGLEQLLHVSSQLPQTISTEAMLTSVCEAISEALGLRQGPDPARRTGTGRLSPPPPPAAAEDEVEAIGRARARSHLAALRAAVRDRRLLPRSPRGGRGARRRRASSCIAR